MDYNKHFIIGKLFILLIMNHKKLKLNDYYKDLNTYLETVVNNVPHTIFWKDENSVFLGCNKLFAKLANLNSPEMIVGKTDYDLPWTKEESDQYIATDKEVIRSGEPKLNIEESQTFQDGTSITLLTSKVPLCDSQGNITGVLGVYTDITERKKLEENLKIALEKAQASDKAKTEFITNISHDLRTPLVGIIGLSNLQINEATSAQEQKYGEWIHSAGNQLLELLDSVIEVTAAERQIEKIKKENINLQQFAEELQALIHPAVVAKKLDFQIKLDNHLPLVTSDRIKLKRIILNLLSNSLKFTKQGTISLTINLLAITEDKAAIKISVSDTGIGISKDKLEKVFDRFYRVHPSYLAEYTGYGLGLYLVKKAIESLGGKINVASEEGKGSCFSLEFNFSLAELDPNAKSPAISEPTFEFQAIIDKLKGSVLVAEDNTLVLYVVKKMLTGLGYQVITASTGKEALQALKTQAFNWGILDIGLPGSDGIEVTEQYREWEQLNNKSRLPIFALTAHAEDKVKHQCKVAGFDQVLLKPFTEKDIKIIQKFLQ